jgi:hypothetical protein
MIQESTTLEWDPIFIDRAPSTALKIYVLFLLVACVVTSYNLVRVWRMVPPFSRKSPATPSAYFGLLRETTGSCGRWIGLIFLAWGLLTSTTVYDLCSTLLLEKVTGRNQMPPMIRDFSTDLSLALFVVLFLYVERWHLLTRMERSRD